MLRTATSLIQFSNDIFLLTATNWPIILINGLVRIDTTDQRYLTPVPTNMAISHKRYAMQAPHDMTCTSSHAKFNFVEGEGFFRAPDAKLTQGVFLTTVEPPLTKEKT